MREVAPTIYVVDDDPSVRKSLERLIRSAGYRAQTFASADDFLRGEKGPGPRCLVSDIRMPGLSGTDLQKELQRQNHSIPLIFITGHGDIPMSVQAMKNGAVDFLTKPYNDEDLLRAIGRALEKDQKHRHAQEKRASIQERVDTLTPAEQDVLRWLITGKLNKQIARKLGIKEKTVRVHRGRVLKKMKASSIADLVRFTHTVFIDPPQE